MAVTVRAVRASNGARDWPRQVAGQADHLQPCGGRGRLHRWTASERRSRRRFNLVAKGLMLSRRSNIHPRRLARFIRTEMGKSAFSMAAFMAFIILCRE